MKRVWVAYTTSNTGGTTKSDVVHHDVFDSPQCLLAALPGMFPEYEHRICHTSDTLLRVALIRPHDPTPTLMLIAERQTVHGHSRARRATWRRVSA
jgi:hypothetical protein